MLGLNHGQPGDGCGAAEQGTMSLFPDLAVAAKVELDGGDHNVIFLAGEQGRLRTQGALKG